MNDPLLPLEGWIRCDQVIARTFKFDDYYQTMAFVNAVAWLSHRADHHPLMRVGYNTCQVEYTTHQTGGLTEKDYACAARVNALLTPL